MLDHLIDFVILAMLVAVMIYVFVLSRRIKALFVALRAMGPLVEQFNDAVDRTERAVPTLVATTTRLTSAAREQTQVAQAAPANDLVSNFYRLLRKKGHA